MDKFILDACCGNRQFWLDKSHPNTLYVDIRNEGPNLSKFRPNLKVRPDKVMDFRALDLKDKSFRLVVFDPPQLFLGEKSELRIKYGSLNKETWQSDLKQGFDECWRVLEDYGVLIFKWSESQIKTKDVLELFSQQPLFGHPSGSKSKTKWFTFMKIPSCQKQEMK